MLAFEIALQGITQDGKEQAQQCGDGMATLGKSDDGRMVCEVCLESGEGAQGFFRL